MRHNTFQNRWEEHLDHSEEVLIHSRSKRYALYTSTDGSTWFLGGDFSGTKEECEAEVRRIMKDVDPITQG
jgi:hypothetical protein